jgi:hypothetical protein
MTEVYLQYGGSFCGTPRGPFLTVKAEWKDSPLPWQEKGLSYTATGYGKRIPTRYMVKHNDRWMRVYSCVYSNAGTAYIGPSDSPIATVDVYN